MSNGNGDDIVRPTTASIDRRVERLEASSADMQRVVDRLELGQSHLREMMQARFSSIDTALTAQTVRTEAVDRKIDDLKSYLQNLITDGLKQAGDVRATPVGRQLAEEIEALETGRKENAQRIERLEGRILYATGVITTLLVLLTLLGPSIRHAVGLP